MEISQNDQGQTLIHLSKPEWEEYGLNAGFTDKDEDPNADITADTEEEIVTSQAFDSADENEILSKLKELWKDSNFFTNPEFIKLQELYKNRFGKNVTAEMFSSVEPKTAEPTDQFQLASTEEEVVTSQTEEDEEGLLGPFKLRACDDIIDRKSRRRRNLD